MNEASKRQGRRTARWAAAWLLSASALSAQGFFQNPLTTAGIDRAGFRIYDLSAFASASTVDDSWRRVVQTVTTTGGFPSYSTYSGISATFGFHAGGREEGAGSFSIVYSPSFSYMTYGQSWNSMTHSLALSWTHKLAPRWHMTTSLSGVMGSFDQILFSPNSEQNLAALSGTAGQLANIVATGQAPAQATIAAQQRLFFGDRMLSAIVTTGITYSHSPRLSFGFTATADRMQHASNSANAPGGNIYLVPGTTNVSGALSMSYALTQRTSLTVSGSYGRTFSSLVETQYTAGNIGMTRKLTRGWFAQGAVGGGYILPVGHISTGVRGTQYQASGGLGYRSTTHTVIGSVGRTFSDYYGTGPVVMLNSSVGWSWQRRGSSWAFQAGVSGDHLLGKQFVYSGAANNGVRTNCGIVWNPYRRASVSLQYAYASFSGIFPLLATGPTQKLNFAQHSIRLSFGMGAGPGGMQTVASSARP